MPTKTVRFKNKSGDWRSKKLDRWEKAYQIQQKRSKRAISIDNSRNANRFMNPANDKLSDKELRTYNSWVKNPARSDLVGIDTKTVGTSKTKIVTLESKDIEKVNTQKPNINVSDLDYQLAYNAHRNTSHTPDVRAKQEQESYVSEMNGFYDDLSKYANTPEQKQILNQEFARYKENYLRKKKDLLGRRSGIASSGIVGPANFPVKRMQKKSDIDHRKTGEFIQWKTKVSKAVERKLKNLSPETIKTKQKKQASLQGLGKETLTTFKKGKIINNKEIERVQIIFTGKPDDNTRMKLKKSGWRWSPRNNAWQRKNTNNAVYSANRIIKEE